MYNNTLEDSLHSAKSVARQSLQDAKTQLTLIHANLIAKGSELTAKTESFNKLHAEWTAFQTAYESSLLIVNELRQAAASLDADVRLCLSEIEACEKGAIERKYQNADEQIKIADMILQAHLLVSGVNLEQEELENAGELKVDILELLKQEQDAKRFELEELEVQSLQSKKKLEECVAMEESIKSKMQLQVEEAQRFALNDAKSLRERVEKNESLLDKKMACRKCKQFVRDSFDDAIIQVKNYVDYSQSLFATET